MCHCHYEFVLLIWKNAIKCSWKKNKTNKGQWAIAHCIAIVFEQKDVNVVYDSVTSYKIRLLLKLQQHAGVKNMQEYILNIRKKIIDKSIQNIQFKESIFWFYQDKWEAKCHSTHVSVSKNHHKYVMQAIFRKAWMDIFILLHLESKCNIQNLEGEVRGNLRSFGSCITRFF